MLAAVIVSAALSALFSPLANVFIRIYTDDPISVKFAVMRMWCVLSCVVLSCLYEIPGGALRGMGHSMLPAVFTVIGSCVLRIIWIYTVFAANKLYWLLLIIYPISWAVTGLALIISYYIICRKAGFYARIEAPETASENTASAEPASEQSEIVDYGT